MQPGDLLLLHLFTVPNRGLGSVGHKEGFIAQYVLKVWWLPMSMQIKYQIYMQSWY